jgi:hypothetical protein
MGIGKAQRLGRFDFFGKVGNVLNFYVIAPVNSVIDDLFEQYGERACVLLFRFLEPLSNEPDPCDVSQVLLRSIPKMLTRVGEPAVMSLEVSQTWGTVQRCSVYGIKNE